MPKRLPSIAPPKPTGGSAQGMSRMPGQTRLPDVRNAMTPAGTVLSQLLNRYAEKLTSPSLEMASVTDWEDPVDWIEKNVYVDRPRDPITAAILPPGPMRLAEYQKRVLREALARNPDGKLRYKTVVWSEPKKSGKTAIAGAITLFAAAHTSAANIFCLANDGKQSADRIFSAVRHCIDLHNKQGGQFRGIKPKLSPPQIVLPNGSVIEAVPCDAAGEAGSEPFLTVWSEMWGFAQTYKERLWTEMTVPPTLDGYAMRWVESYAGYEDESTILWDLYTAGVTNGRQIWDDLPVYVNDTARQLTFWSHVPRQPWQTPDYYASEALQLRPNEFQRIHRNEWVTSTTSFLEDISQWDRLKDESLAYELPAGDMTPIVVALDASVSNDCCAIYGVSRHPEDSWDAERRRIIERVVRVWYPPKGGKMDYSATLEPAIREIAERYNVYKFVYDPYQLHKLCTDLRIAGVGSFQEFNQMGRRLKADKQFYDLIVQGQFAHSGHDDVRVHVLNAAAKSEQEKYIRLVKKAAGRPIDLAVAASMACDELLRLNV